MAIYSDEIRKKYHQMIGLLNFITTFGFVHHFASYILHNVKYIQVTSSRQDIVVVELLIVFTLSYGKRVSRNTLKHQRRIVCLM